MGLALAQLLEIVRRKIDDQEPPAGGDETGRLAQRPGRVVEIVQHLVQHHEVEAAAPEGRRVNVALAQIDPRQTEPFEVGAGDRQHGMARIEPGGAGRARREQAEHLAGAGAQIDHMADRPIAQHVEHRRLDGRFGHMQGAQPVPFRGEPGEEGLRRFSPLGSDRIEPGPILRERRRRTLQGGDQRLDEADGCLAQAEEGPGAFAVTLDQA